MTTKPLGKGSKEYLFELKYASGEKAFYRYQAPSMASAMAYLSVHLVKQNLHEGILMTYAVERKIIQDSQQARMAKQICEDWKVLQNPEEAAGWAGTETETGNDEEEE